MTATATPSTTNTATSAGAATSSAKVSLTRVIKGEWIKFRSVRSTRLTLAGAAFATVAFGMIFSITADSGDAAPGPAAQLSDPIELALGGTTLAEMIVGVLAVLLVAGEYSTGLIRTTIAAVGGRVRLLIAKSTVVAAVTAVAMAVASFLAVWLGQAVYAGDEPTLSVFDSDVLEVLAGTTVYLTGIALIATALAFMTRSTGAAVGALFGGVFIGPQLLNLLPDSFTDVVLKYLPSEAGSAMMSRVVDPDLLSTGAAYAVLIAWVVGFLAVAGVMLQRRDA